MWSFPGFRRPTRATSTSAYREVCQTAMPDAAIEEEGKATQDDEDEHLHAERPSRPWWRPHWRGMGGLLELVLAAGVLGLVLFVWLLTRPPRFSLHDERSPSDGLTFTGGQLTLAQHLATRPCGHTAEDAVARGCEFDQVTTSWLPPRCIDRELQEEFLTTIRPGGWRFWAQDDQTQEHDAEQLGWVTDEIWATNEWHMWHCLYVWRKLARAVRNGKPIDGSTLSLTHTDHCAYMTGSEYATTQSEVRTLVSINFPPC